MSLKEIRIILSIRIGRIGNFHGTVVCIAQTFEMFCHVDLEAIGFLDVCRSWSKRRRHHPLLK